MSMQTGAATAARALLHFRMGWWTLLFFASVGLGLEALHGFKIGWYLDVANETRRLMFRLGHAHGVLLALVHLAYGATLRLMQPTPRAAVLGSRALVAASALLPVGFLLGAVGSEGGDPGLGIALVPVGAACLLAGAFSAGWSLRRPSRP